jgi:hypothetical protein
MRFIIASLEGGHYPKRSSKLSSKRISKLEGNIPARGLEYNHISLRPIHSSRVPKSGRKVSSGAVCDITCCQTKFVAGDVCNS